MNWRGFMAVESVMDGCEKILQFMQERQCYRILNDNTNVEGIWSGASKWMGNNWMKRMYTAGMVSFVWVYSPSVLSRKSMDKALQHTEEPALIKTFDDIEQAKFWLQAN